MKSRLLIITALLLSLPASAAPISGVAARSSFSTASSGRTPDKTVDGSGLNTPGNPDDPAAWEHEGGNGTFGGDINWLAFARSTDPLPGVGNHWIAFDLGAEVELSSMNVFNFGVSSGGNNARGVNQADIYYRSDSFGTNTDNNNTPFDPTGWTLLGTAGTQTFTIGPSGGFQGADNIDLSGITARYFAIDVNTSHGDASFVGLGEVQFFEKPSGPVLEVDGASPNSDFAFGNVFGPSAPTRTVIFTNNVVGGDTITIQSVTLTDDGGGVFGSPTVTYSGTNVLSSGDTVSIEVPVILGGTGSVAGILDIDTTTTGGDDPNSNDKSLGLSATLFSSGQKLNNNGSFASALSDWAGDSILVEPGIAPGSSSGARVRGVGDPSAVTSSSAFQANGIPDGASDFEFNAYFTPAAASEFGDYAGTTIPSADGSFTDRTFQWVLLGADTPRPDDGNPDIGFDDTVMANAIVNIAYLPDGNTTGGTPDFYVFDGSSGPNGTWVATGIGAIAGSIDDDDDGNLDGVTDTLNVYRLSVKGSGFGTISASYDVSVTKVAGPDTFTSGSATSLTTFHGLDGNANTPAAHGFCTNDVSFTSNFGDGIDQGLCTPFWIDDVCYFNIAGADPSLTVASTPDSIVVSAPATTGTSSFSIRNDGSATNLDIDSASFVGGTGFSISSPSVPFSVAPGALQEIVIQWDSATASDTFETTTLTITDTVNGLSGNVSLKADLSFGGFVVLDYNDHVLGNMADAANAGTGIGFTEDLWNTGTGTQQIVAGDLDLTTVPGYSIPATGTPQSHSTNNTAARQQERQIDIGDGINPVWFSFLASKPTSGGRVGINFNRNSIGAQDPRVIWLNNEVQFRAPGFGEVADTPLTSTGDTILIVGRITINDLPTGEDRVEVWVNPADMTSISALGSPDINYAGSDSLDDGLTRLNPSVYGATGLDAPIMDNVRLSDLEESAAFDVIRTGVVPVIDPLLEVDPGGDPNFAYGNIFASGSASRTVTFVNNSDSGSETITINSVTLTDDAGGVFGTPIVTYSGTNVLANGDTVSIQVPASTAVGGVFAGEITIDTLSSGLFDPNNNDMVLPLTAAFYLNGDKINDNGFFDNGLTGWGGGPALTSGIAPGSVNGARLIGAGDPSGGFSSSAFQANGIPDGAADWEFTAYFTPASATVFGDYAGTTISAADGLFTDRTFQWVLLGADTPRPDDGTPDIGFDDTVMANAIVNIAYLPDGNTTGGTPDFYVFDGSSGPNGTWVATGIGAIDGSIDADDDGDPSNGIGDGDLDDTTDTLNLYRLRVVGSGFGSAGATYDVSVSKVLGPDAFTSGSAAGLTVYHGLSGDTNAPAAHGFATNDVSTTSNFGDGTDQGITTPFWVDDVCFFAGAAPDPNLVVVGVPEVLSAFAPDTDTTATFLLRNDGASLSLDVSSISLTGTGFSLNAPSLPASIPPGGGEIAELLFDSTVLGGANAAISLMTISSNDPNEPTLEFPLSGTATSFSKLIANEGFEVGGFDDTTDTDTFAVWTELNNPELVLDVPGLDDTTMTAAYVSPRADGIAGVSQFFAVPVNNFEVQTDFAIRDAGSGIRQFSFEMETAVGNNGGRINLRYQAGAFWMFNNVASQGGSGWQSLFPATLTPSVDSNGDGDFNDAGESSTVYTLVISATNWGYPSLSYDVTILDSGGGTVGSATGIGFVQNAVPDAGAQRIISRNEFGDNPGFWLDDACASGSVVILDPGPINITGFSIDPSTGAGSITFDSVDGAPYSLRGSDDVNDLDLFNDAANLIDNTAGTGASTTLPFSDPDAIGKPVKAYRIQSP